MAALSSFIVTRNDRYAHDCTEQLLEDGGALEYVYHDRTGWRCAVFVGKRCGSKGYPQKNFHLFGPLKQHLSGELSPTMTLLKEQCARGSESNYKHFTPRVSRDL